MTFVFSPTKLKELCEEYFFSPSKKYGQNYLISDAPLQKMGQAASLSKNDTIVEIGSGFGQLTLFLANQVDNVICFEIEQKLKPYWEKVLKEHHNITFVWGNVLRELQSLPEGRYKVVANLPYQITSAMLRGLLEAKNKPGQIVVMVQREVAQRICAQPGDMSLLSVSVQYFGVPTIVSKVSKGNFWPKPKVDSAILSIKDIRETQESEQFFRVVKAGFSSKRKQLWKNIASSLSLPKDFVKACVLQVCGNERVRAQELSIEEWESLVVQLDTYGTRT